MKKLYFSFLSVFAGLSMNAQTLTQANHAPANGDMFDTYQCDSTGITPGASGPGTVWNFSTIVTHSNVVTNYTASTVSNSSYPSADIAVASATSNISYYKSSATELKYWGGNIAVGGIAATINYTSPAIYAAYPMGLSSSTAATTGGTLNVLSNNGTFTGNSNVIADGTGTLITPGGTFTNVLRVVTSQTINFIASFVTGTVVQVNYDYYSSGTKASMFTISTSSLTTNIGAPSQQTVVTRYKAVPLGIEMKNRDKIEVSIFPNPSSTSISFTTESKSAVSVLVYDITGKLIEKQNIFNGSAKLDVSLYSAGVYIYKITGSNNESLKTGKLSVTH